MIQLMTRLSTKRLRDPVDPVPRIKLELGERHVALFCQGNLVLNDVRREVEFACKRSCLIEWQASRSQAAMACGGAAGLFKLVASNRWLGGDRFALRVLTDTLHFRHERFEGKTVLTELICDECNVVDNVRHLTSCNAAAAQTQSDKVLRE
jgi:hypothetical protein